MCQGTYLRDFASYEKSGLYGELGISLTARKKVVNFTEKWYNMHQRAPVVRIWIISFYTGGVLFLPYFKIKLTLYTKVWTIRITFRLNF